jgi:quinol-cytochrome oxidoreductase complex cytochrome b subunit
MPLQRPNIERIRKSVTQNEIWKSIFRHSYQDNQRTRALMILDNVFLHLHPVRVSRHGANIGYTWGMGGITFLLFLILTVTGVILMFYYRPVAEYAFDDMKYLMNDVAFGPFIRNMHRWAAHGMVITVMLHMFRVFLTGSYKPPRQFNWGIGVVLLLLTLLLSFTGYLLPWDQLAIWAVTVGTNMARATPLLGHEGPFGPQLGLRSDNDVRFILLGGTQVGAATLLRFYVLHCIFLPIVAAVFMAVHFWRIRKDGGISGPKVETREMKKARDVIKTMQIKRVEILGEESIEVAAGEPLETETVAQGSAPSSAMNDNSPEA